MGLILPRRKLLRLAAPAIIGLAKPALAAWPGSGQVYPQGPVCDPSFSSVVLLAHFDGTNGATNFTDNSTFNQGLIGNNGGALTTTSPKFGSACLTTPNGNSNAQVTGGSAITSFQFGSAPFAIEGWFNLSSFAGATTMQFMGNFALSTNLGWEVGFDGSGNFGFGYSTSGTNAFGVKASFTPSTSTWFYWAVDCDSGGTIRVYGPASSGTASTLASGARSGTLFASTRSMFIGNDGNFTRNVTGTSDEIRVTKGVNRYGTLTISVPTAAFPNC